MHRNSASPRRQRGAALLLLMLAVIVATSTLLLSNLSRHDFRTQQIVNTQDVLAEARLALMDYAIVNADRNPGRPISLPCPDVDESSAFAEGIAHDTACGAAGVTVLGRLPWKTLGLPALKDSASACLWYVVSGAYKDADVSTSPMINTDSNGQLQLFDIESGVVTEGVLAEDRPVAMVIAAMQSLPSQTRPGHNVSTQCVPGASTSSYLDTDSVSGVTNAAVNGTANAIDVLGFAPGFAENHNDRVTTISRLDLERRLLARPDFLSTMRSLGLAAAACVANYGTRNSGGAGDKRLPWPAPIALSDYQPDSNYDDSNAGLFSGRLANVADDSNAVTGNSIAEVLSDCDVSDVPEWTPVQLARWQHWKDHFFYAVATAHSPAAPVPSSCGTCLTVNGGGQYAAVLIFANVRLSDGSQRRNAPPTDTDTKDNSSNYLEDLNASSMSGTATNFVSGPASAAFNDLLFCIDDQLVVSEC